MSVLGVQIGLARIISAVLLSILVGLTMAIIFREKVDKEKLLIKETEESQISNKVMFAFFGLMIGVLVVNGLQIDKILKYFLMGLFTFGLVGLVLWKFKDHITQKWLNETWNFSKMLLPLLFIGVFIAGFIIWIISLIAAAMVVYLFATAAFNISLDITTIFIDLIQWSYMSAMFLAMFGALGGATKKS